MKQYSQVLWHDLTKLKKAQLQPTLSQKLDGKKFFITDIFYNFFFSESPSLVTYQAHNIKTHNEWTRLRIRSRQNTRRWLHTKLIWDAS